MLVLQQVNVLPKGSHIVIADGGNPVVYMSKSNVDESLVFETASDAHLYEKCFCNYRVSQLMAFSHPIDIKDDTDITYIIQIREGYENENKGAASVST